MRPRWILPAIVLSQVLVTSTWFAANAVASDIGKFWTGQASTGLVTMSVQLGFISGTLLAALTGIADRISSRQLFCVSALCAALANLAILLGPANATLVVASRFLTGLTLAGVYPVGMKLAASWYAEGLGRALGYLVGALVLGTASTHLMRAFQVGSHWQMVIWLSSGCAILGGLLICAVPEGPYLRRGTGRAFDVMQVASALQDREFRGAAFGYFGHMWELYAFWAFMPYWIQTLKLSSAQTSLACFSVIASGAVGCVLGGLAALRVGSRVVASICLIVSSVCCLISPLMFGTSIWLLLPFMILWGIAVVSDSPQLSSLNAQTAPRAVVGSALTATTCIGFSITIVSLLWLDVVMSSWHPRYLLVTLMPGPLIGAWFLSKQGGTGMASA